MLGALECGEVDYVPCSFMLFSNLYSRSRTDREFVEKQVAMGLDAYAHVGHLPHSLHRDAECSEWVERKNGEKYFCRRIDTPKGPLTQRVRQVAGWPDEGRFPLFDDWIVPRAEEVLVKPEEDLEKIRYLFGEFRDEDIRLLREQAREAKKLSDEHGLLQVGGYKGAVRPGEFSDVGVMGCDAMAWLSGFERIMVLSVTRPDLIKGYAEMIHKWNLRQIEIYLDVTEADVIWRRGWYETTEFWTPAGYRRIIAPTIEKEAQLVHQAGRKYGYIITSAFLPILDEILDAGIDMLIGLDPAEGKGTDLRTVKGKFAARGKGLWGGVSGAVTVELGTEKQTEQAVRDALRILGTGGGFVLSPVDNVREDTPRAWSNTQVFVDTWKTFRHQLR